MKPRTVISWQRKRFRDHWTQLSRAGRRGRPPIAREVRDLIRKISDSNPSWGSRRIRSELRKLGIDVAPIARGSTIPYFLDMLIHKHPIQLLVITSSLSGCSTLPKHGWDGKGRGSFLFSYQFIGGTHEHKTVLREAMTKWSEVVEVGFIEIDSDSEKPDIVFKWKSLDGPDEMHARTAFLSNRVYVEFDLDEPWRNYPEDAFLHIALHELGHVLGLMHTSNHGSIMYVDPYVDVYHPMNQLAQEDMKNVRMVYRAH